MRFLLIFISTLLFASVGKIVSYKGQVDVIRNNKILSVKAKNFSIDVNDTITTGANSKAKIVFKDNTIITIGANSVFNVNSYVFNNKNANANFSFLKGTFISVTGKIGKIAPKRFKLKTKNSSIGIRGTIVIGEVGIVDTIGCTQGAVIVTNKIGEKVFLKAGKAVKVGAQFISQPFIISAKLFGKFTKSLLLSPFEVGEFLFKNKQKKLKKHLKELNTTKKTMLKNKDLIFEIEEEILEDKLLY